MEARGFREAIEEIRALGAEVLGASLDGARAQSAFAGKLGLPFPMICDTTGDVARAYGALGPGYAARVTFLIDKEGTIRKVWPKVSPAKHAAEVVEALRELQSRAAS